MKKFIGVALAALAMATVATPADAQRGKEKAPSYKFSKKVQPLLAKAQDALAKQDVAGAQAALNEAATQDKRTPDDDYMIASMRLNAAIMSKDNAQIEAALEGALAAGRLTDEERANYIRNLGALALQREDYAKAANYFQQSLAANPNDTQLQTEVAELQRRQGLNAEAVKSLQAAIAKQEELNPGQRADEAWYRRALALAYDGKLNAEITSTSLALVAAHPNSTNWRDSLVIWRDNGKHDDQALLDMMRLQREVQALTGERDFAEYAEAATLAGYPGESKAVIDEALAKNAAKADSPWVKELLGQVAPRVAGDRKSLPGLEKEAAAAKDGRAALGTGDAYLGYGEWQKAAEMYKLALTKGGLARARGNTDAQTVNLRLGYALAKAGDKAGAAAAFDAVNSGPSQGLAEFYKVWLKNLG